MEECSVALDAARGNVAIAAAALGIGRHSLKERIRLNRKLNILWGNRGERGTPLNPPDEEDVLDRRKSDLPVTKTPAEVIELAEVVKEADRRRYRAALRKAGVPEKQLEKMKSLDGLASSTGMLLSVSLQQTHQNYLGQLHMLSSVCDDTAERLKGYKQEDGSYKPLSAEDASYLLRCYTEMVKEQGRGYQLMMEGTQAMIRMMMMAKGDEPENRQQKTPAWKMSKKVNASH